MANLEFYTLFRPESADTNIRDEFFLASRHEKSNCLMPKKRKKGPSDLIYFILFYFILFYFILFYFILFYLFYFILFYFYFILFYSISFYSIFPNQSQNINNDTSMDIHI